MLCEPGEESLAHHGRQLCAGNAQRLAEPASLGRSPQSGAAVTGIERQTRGEAGPCKSSASAKKTGTLSLIDLRRSAGENVALRGARLEFREQFRRFLRRQFPGYKIAELTTEADLEHSLSPAYPRALLRQGASAWAAIGASPDAFHCDGVLTFGLIWLDYLRLREPAW